MGHRTHRRSPDAVRKDRRYRRPRPLFDPRVARRSDVHGVVARLRTHRWTAGSRNARNRREPARDGRAERERGCPVLSGRVLVRDAQHSGQGRVSGDRPQRQRHRGRHAQPKYVAGQHQDGCVHHVSPNRKQVHAHDSGGSGIVAEFGRGLEPAHSVRTSRRHHDGFGRTPGPASHARIRRLDRSHCKGRDSGCEAAAAARRRTQRRHYRMGLGRADGVSPR